MNKEEAETIASFVNPALAVHSGPKKVTVEMTVHRAATQTDEHFGIIGAYHKNPIIHFWMQLSIKLRGLYRQWQHYLQTKVKKS